MTKSGMSEWQDIATAPKDGTRIIVASTESDDLEIVRWADHRTEGGWSNGDWTYDVDDFTHWMPLPSPPVSGLDRSENQPAKREQNK